jgi:hypothetical protein
MHCGIAGGTATGLHWTLAGGTGCITLTVAVTVELANTKEVEVVLASAVEVEIVVATVVALTTMTEIEIVVNVDVVKKFLFRRKNRLSLFWSSLYTSSLLTSSFEDFRCSAGRASSRVSDGRAVDINLNASSKTSVQLMWFENA